MGVAIAVDWRLTCSPASFFDLVFAYDDHLFSVPVSCAECGRRQRSQLRLVRMRTCNDRMGGAEHAGVGEGVRQRQCGSVVRGRADEADCGVSGSNAQLGQMGLTVTSHTAAHASTTSAANSKT